jgi:hypothetical protein
VHKSDNETETNRTSLGLSVPQVAGSAIAAVMAAVLASRLGVYGTIIGAGVVSVVATCGGTVFQHLFRRTGEQIREVTVQVKPKGRGRQVPVRRVPGDRDPGAVPPTVAAPWPEDLGTQLIEQVADETPAEDPDATRMLSLGPDRSGLDRTQMVPVVPQVPETAVEQPPVLDEEFTEATTHGTRVRGTKRSVLAAVIAFVVAMGGITGFELLSGHDLNGGTGTTVGGAVTGSGGKKSTPSSPTPADTTSPTPTPSSNGSGDGQSSPGSGAEKSAGSDSTPDPTPSPTSSDSGSDSGDGGESATPTPTPTPTPSGSSGADSTDSTSGDSAGE